MYAFEYAYKMHRLLLLCLENTRPCTAEGTDLLGLINVMLGEACLYQLYSCTLHHFQVSYDVIQWSKPAPVISKKDFCDYHKHWQKRN